MKVTLNEEPVMRCPVCGVEMDTLMECPRLRIMACDNRECPAYDRPLLSENLEYQQRMLPQVERRMA